VRSEDGFFEHQCEHCLAWYFESETVAGATGGRKVFSRCCQHGRLADVPSLPPAPQPLAELLSGRIAQSVRLNAHPFTDAGFLTRESLPPARKRNRDHFIDNIRRYNTSLAFASYCDNMASPSKKLKVDEVPLAAQGGPPVYILHGRVYHDQHTIPRTRLSAEIFTTLYLRSRGSRRQARNDVR
jgi:hypothetical protein